MLLFSSSLAAAVVPHGFTTRAGGVSGPPFSSLNFGNPAELPPGVARDPRANIEENFRRVLHAIGAPGRRVIQVHQVHGAEVFVHRAARRGAETAAPVVWGDAKADAIVTDDPGCVVAVRVADCCPVLLASGDGRIVAAVHAGWRGVIGGVAINAVRAMLGLGSTDIVAAVGPCISADHFEVGPEVAAEFDREFGESSGLVRPAGAGSDRSFVDLKESLRRQLLDEGATSVETLPHCTVRDADLFFSHRRDRGVTGRMVALIGCRE